MNSHKFPYHFVAVVLVAEILWLYALYYVIQGTVTYISQHYFDQNMHTIMISVPVPVQNGSVVIIDGIRYRLQEVKEDTNRE